jgi:hypothetical protein
MRTWQVERRKRSRHLIELGGLVFKAGIVDLTGDDRATILGALLWMADKLKSDQGERARALWVAKGKQALDMDPGNAQGDRSNCFSSSSLMHDNGRSVERLSTRTSFEHAMGAGRGATELAIRQKDILLRALEDSTPNEANKGLPMPACVVR